VSPAADTATLAAKVHSQGASQPVQAARPRQPGSQLANATMSTASTAAGKIKWNK
jgi:hypothetical protein